MNTVYFIVFTILGGLLTLFGAAGWSSYNEKKLPDMSTLFRWFFAGLVTAGLGSYTWLYGFNGNPEQLLSQVGEVLEVDTTMKSLSGAVGVDTVVEKVSEVVEEIKVGMPTF